MRMFKKLIENTSLSELIEFSIEKKPGMSFVQAYLYQEKAKIESELQRECIVQFVKDPDFHKRGFLNNSYHNIWKS